MAEPLIARLVGGGVERPNGDTQMPLDINYGKVSEWLVGLMSGRCLRSSRLPLPPSRSHRPGGTPNLAYTQTHGLHT